ASCRPSSPPRRREPRSRTRPAGRPPPSRPTNGTESRAATSWPCPCGPHVLEEGSVPIPPHDSKARARGGKRKGRKTTRLKGQTAGGAGRLFSDRSRELESG